MSIARIAYANFLLVVVLFLATACTQKNNSSNIPPAPSTPTPTPTPTPIPDSALTGVFSDSPVEGLRYVTPTINGTTNTKGEYRYIAGETVEFFLGNISIGSTSAKAVVTPVDVAGTNVPYTDDRVTNRIRLLLSLDSEPNQPGITISPSSSFANVVFSSDESTFAVSGVDLVTKAQALAHFENNLRRMGQRTTTVKTAPAAITGGVASLPSAYDDMSGVFGKYTSVTAPNGKPIHIFAQNSVDDAMILRSRQIMAFFLADDTVFGGNKVTIDKATLANRMADNNAALMIFETESASEAAFITLCKLVATNKCDDPDFNNAFPHNLRGQPLYATEIRIEGSTDYMNPDAATNNGGKRDASFEEILHLVQNSGLEPAPSMQTATQLQNAANDAAYGAGFSPGTDCSSRMGTLWLVGTAHNDTCTEWEEEEVGGFNSLSSEHFATIVEVYYGLWGHTDEGVSANAGEAFSGEYKLNNRAELNSNATAKVNIPLIQKHFPEYLHYEARLDSGFTGNFEMTFDAAKEYTHKSQYLLNVTLTGSNNANITGNGQNNILKGNSGDNILDGQGGTDTVVLDGGFSDFTVTLPTTLGGDIQVSSSNNGTDTLKNIEVLRFNDRFCTAEQLQANSNGSTCTAY